MRTYYFINWLKWIFFLLIIHLLFRIVFFHLYVSEVQFYEAVMVFSLGTWIDLAMILILNLPILFIQHFVSDSYNYRKTFLLLALLILNFPFLALNALDLAYYNFIGRRSNADLIDLVLGIDKWGLGLFKIYWFLLLGFIILIIVVFRLGESWLAANAKDVRRKKVHFSLWFLVLIFSGLIVRGIGKRPLMPTTPLLYVSPALQDVAGNSTLNFIYSIVKRQTHVKQETYYTESRLDSLYSINQQFSGREFKKMNVCVIVMESFSLGFMEEGDHLYVKTPFLDSIRKESIWCDHAFGSRFESNKGLFSIMTGIPSLLDEPLYYSPYSNLKFKSLGKILKDEGYSTDFFMGTEYDHFGFAKACKIAGIDHYHSAEEMKKNAIHDGYWGIYDHLYFKYAGSVIKKISQPFFTTIFNVSTHHPYAVPDSFARRFKSQGLRDDQVSIRYFDQVLSDLFFDLKKMRGYENTIFIFVADHANPLRSRIPMESPANLQIPLMVHIPGKKMGMHISRPVQQSDIVPTILDLLDYPKPFESFGKSILDSLSMPFIWKKGDQYYSFDNRYMSFFNEKTGEVDHLYDLQTDTELKHDILNKNMEITSKHTLVIRAYIQRYHQFLLKK